jgi:hypothetical protein
MERGRETNLHAEIRVRHSAIHGQFSKRSPTILGHSVEDGFGLEASRFQRGARDVAFLRIGSDADFKFSALARAVWMGR